VSKLKTSYAKYCKKSRLACDDLAALGVVFGDIGTSPLYALKNPFMLHMLPSPKQTYWVFCPLFSGA
jgi:K+ transporter